MTGFTLIELMVTVAVLVIVMMIGVPSIVQLKRNNELVTATNSIVTALNMAKSEAVKRGVDVSVNSIGGDWANGWTVDIDGGALVRVYDAPSAETSVNVAQASVTYQALGNVTNAVCFDIQVPLNEDVGTTIDRSVDINTGGRIATCRVLCAAIGPGNCD